MATTSVLKVNSPNVNKKTVIYNFYRDMLGNYNDRANKMLENLPANTYIREDQGIVKQLQSIIQTPHGNGWTPQLSPGSNFQHNSHAHEVQQSEPPRCIQNAMLTKDKKPFTYTPGGIDLSEIRSPRMAKRLEMNAQNEGTVSNMSHVQPNTSVNRLPPSAIAAMQPALPVQVLPKIPVSVPVVKKQPPQSPTPTLKINEQLKPPMNKKPISSPPIPPPPPPPLPQKLPSNIIGQQALPKIETQNSPVRKISPPFSITQFSNLNKTPTPWTSSKLQDPYKHEVITSIKTSFPEKITTKVPLSTETDIKLKTNEYIIPIKVEENGSSCNYRNPKSNQSIEQEVSKITNRIIPIKIDHKQRTTNPQLSPKEANTGAKYKPNPIAPIQSRSFQILQKLTDSYSNNENGSRVTSHSPKFYQEFATNRGQRSNTHSPALDMYEERIRSNQQSGCGKAYQILQQAEICDKSKLPSNTGQYSLAKPKINGYNNINYNNFNNIVTVPVTNNLDSIATSGLINTDQNYNDISNNNNTQRRVLKQYGRTKTHSRLLHLLTSDNN